MTVVDGQEIRDSVEWKGLTVYTIKALIPSILSTLGAWLYYVHPRGSLKHLEPMVHE